MSETKRESGTVADVYYHDCRNTDVPCQFAHCEECGTFECESGWYWGALRNGPFATEAEARADAAHPESNGAEVES